MARKFLDEAGLTYLWGKIKNYIDSHGGGGANNGVLTIQRNGTNVATFSANQATNVTANINATAVYYGTAEPSSSLGSNGDIYIMLEE